MADPILPTAVRAHAVFHGSSGLPEDRFVHTFAFKPIADASHADIHAAVVLALRDFYETTNGTAASLETFLGGQIPRTAYDITTYKLSEPVPREPLTSSETFSGNAPASSLPAEVAVCLSYYSDRPLPRQRGRIYFGPLASTAVGTLSAGDVRPSANMITALTTAATRLALRTDITWGLISKASGEFLTITDGWVDNALDTQRRRGLSPSTRTEWSG